MPPGTDFVELIGLEPDERMLRDDLSALPDAVGRPETLPESSSRRRLVGIGAALTGVTLVGGIALLAIGIVDAISGGVGGAAIALILLGTALVSTHWGWVHVAEISANSLDRRSNQSLLDRQRHWLAGIEPYTRWEVSTVSGEDGSITILTTRHRPIRCGERRFTFAREIVASELHSGDEPAAVVTERAELLRRHAAADTAQERERYQTAHEAYQRALIAEDDEEQRVAALRAASEALSEQLNANLRDPPLIE